MPSSHLCVFGCVTKGVTVHKFPNPSKYPKQFRAWVELADLSGIKDDFIYKNKKVCNKHFTKNVKNRNNRLNVLAVPTLQLPKASIVILELNRGFQEDLPSTLSDIDMNKGDECGQADPLSHITIITPQSTDILVKDHTYCRKPADQSSQTKDSATEEQVLPTLTRSSSPVASRMASPVDYGREVLDMPYLVSPLLGDGLSTAALHRNTTVSPNHEAENELEEDILQILGEAPQPDLALGKNIHKDIAFRWQDILLKGLSKDVKETLMKKYLIPANCNLLVAPILNPEAKAAVPEVIAKRDTTLLQKQNQIGIALAALSQVSEMILKNETSRKALFQPLSDACRILLDSHSIETKTRRSILMSSINTNLRDTLVNSDRDKYLFGENLAEKLKAAKTVQITGESLLRNDPVASSRKNTTTRSNPKRNLNYRGQIQRKPSNRANELMRGRNPMCQTRKQHPKQLATAAATAESDFADQEDLSPLNTTQVIV